MKRGSTGLSRRLAGAALAGAAALATTAVAPAVAEAAPKYVWVYTDDFRHKATYTDNYQGTGRGLLQACNWSQPAWDRHSTRARAYTYTGSWYDIRTAPSDNCKLLPGLTERIQIVEVCGLHGGQWSGCRTVRV